MRGLLAKCLKRTHRVQRRFKTSFTVCKKFIGRVDWEAGFVLSVTCFCSRPGSPAVTGRHKRRRGLYARPCSGAVFPPSVPVRFVPHKASYFLPLYNKGLWMVANRTTPLHPVFCGCFFVTHLFCCLVNDPVLKSLNWLVSTLG